MSPVSVLPLQSLLSQKRYDQLFYNRVWVTRYITPSWRICNLEKSHYMREKLNSKQWIIIGCISNIHSRTISLSRETSQLPVKSTDIYLQYINRNTSSFLAFKKPKQYELPLMENNIEWNYLFNTPESYEIKGTFLTKNVDFFLF